jgi:uncharacterized protein with HEPN domain
MIAQRPQSVRLQNINTAVCKIGRFLRGTTFEEFTANALIHDAVVWNFEVIADESDRLRSELKARAPEVKWDELANMGLSLRQAYEDINDRDLWESIENDLPPLAVALRRLGDQEELHRRAEDESGLNV